MKSAEPETRRAEVRSGFTLIELLVVITIIAILMALLFPAFKGVQDQAKRTQAKNDVTQIVTAVNAFYTEYGKYPTTATNDANSKVGDGGNANSTLFTELRGVTATTLNPKQISFINLPEAKDQTNPRSGIKTSTNDFYDPWGTPYAAIIDADYSNDIPNPYSSNAGSTPIRAGVIAWSLGKNQTGGSGNKQSDDSDDDVISWQ